MTKTKTVTLIPYKYCVSVLASFDEGSKPLGTCQKAYVIKDHAHPDPSKLMTWGYTPDGMLVSDFNRSFARLKESPVVIRYSITGTRTARQEQERKMAAVRKYLSSIS